MGDVGNDYGGDAWDEDGYATVARALDLDKGALDPIKGASDDLYGGALLEIYLGGVEVGELLVVGVAHLDEVLHLAVGHDDGHTATLLGGGEVLQEGDLGLEGLDAATCGVGKQQVADGGHELAHFALTTVGDHLDMHGDEAAHSPTLEEGLGLELATKRGAHGEPHGLVGKGLWACFYGCLHGMNVQQGMFLRLPKTRAFFLCLRVLQPIWALQLVARNLCTFTVCMVHWEWVVSSQEMCTHLQR